MITYKTEQEIQKIAKGGAILKNVLGEVINTVKPGITTKELDEKAEKLIYKQGGSPGFKRVKNYRWTICSPVNEQVVHTPPTSRALENGDVLTIDCGVFYEGFHTDAAKTVVVGKSTQATIAKFLEVGKKTLQQAISKAILGNRIGHISGAIESGIRANNYQVIKELTGHGVGRQLHEDPLIPGISSADVNKTPELKAGMVLAVEVIYSFGTDKITYESHNDWSIKTADGSISACFEDTIAITKKKTLILT